MNTEQRFISLYNQALKHLKSHKVLLLWATTYTSFNDRFSVERLDKFQKLVDNLDW